jgi:hypothetical protein
MLCSTEDLVLRTAAMGAAAPTLDGAGRSDTCPVGRPASADARPLIGPMTFPAPSLAYGYCTTGPHSLSIVRPDGGDFGGLKIENPSEGSEED